nr:MAG TPA: Type II secretory pathway pseudopilin [Bacteriophage sp.]
MKRETIFLGFFSLLLALGFDALCSDAHAGIIIWLACVALWGVCTTLTLSEVVSRQRRELAELREKEEKGK